MAHKRITNHNFAMKNGGISPYFGTVKDGKVVNVVPVNKAESEAFFGGREREIDKNPYGMKQTYFPF